MRTLDREGFCWKSRLLFNSIILRGAGGPEEGIACRISRAGVPTGGICMVEPDGVEIVQIDEALRNGVRKRCGHGCIRCGVTIYLYVRLPIEDEAGVPAPSVVLLCPECLGLLRNRPMASVQYAALLARPIARDPHFDRSQLPYTMLLPEMHVGGSIPVRNTSIPIMIGGHAPLIFSPPTSGVGALHISLQLSGEDGKPCLLIDSNRWCAPEGGWTFSRRGNCYIVESSFFAPGT